MVRKEKVLLIIVLAVVILSLILAPKWSMAFLILFGMISLVVVGVVEKKKPQRYLPVITPASAVVARPTAGFGRAQAWAQASVTPALLELLELRGVRKLCAIRFHPVIDLQFPAPSLARSLARFSAIAANFGSIRKRRSVLNYQQLKELMIDELTKSEVGNSKGNHQRSNPLPRGLRRRLYSGAEGTVRAVESV